MPISDEELIAFLLGDVTPHQRHTIEIAMGLDPTIGERLGQLRLLLGQLNSLHLHHEPPADLFERTINRIEEAESEEKRFAEASTPAGETNAGETSAPLKAEPQLQPAQASNFAATAPWRNRQSFWDSTALVVCLGLLSCMLLPTVLKARFESRKAQCAANLQFLGHGLIDIALSDPRQRFPEVRMWGPESFAGIYAVRLRDAGLLASPSKTQCASLIGYNPDRGDMELNAIPTLPQLRSMDLENLEICRKTVGGDYGYSLGVVENGKPVAARYEGNSQFAIMADPPTIINGQEHFVAHDGIGVNVLFEDGHVSFVRMVCWEDATCDDPFFNLIHAREAGLNKRDACLGPSHFGPMGND